MDLLTPKDVAATLMTSTDFVCKLFNRGELQGFRAGRHLRIYAASVTEYVESRGNKKRPKPEKTPMPRPPKKPQVTADFACRFMKVG